MAFNGDCLLLLAGPLFSTLELISPMSCDNQCRGELDLCLFYEQCPSCIKTKNAGASAELSACIYLVSVKLKAQMRIRNHNLTRIHTTTAVDVGYFVHYMPSFL